MAKLRLKLVFPPQLIRQPVIHDPGKQFDVVPNILRADVEIDKGWVILELEGDGGKIDLAVSWLAARGIGTEPVDASTSAQSRAQRCYWPVQGLASALMSVGSCPRAPKHHLSRWLHR